MKIRVLFFAGIRDVFQSSERLCEVRDGAAVEEVLEHLLTSPEDRTRFKETLCFAVNCRYVSPSYPLCEGDEVALIPPVAGG